MPDRKHVLLAGATGFVGRHVFPELLRAGWSVRCATRDLRASEDLLPDREWVYLDVNEPSSIPPALSGCRAALYLVHGMASGPGYLDREISAAHAFAKAAGEQGLHRIVYLGGVRPEGEPSEHLSSRLMTGEILRREFRGTIELRAGMIIGAGSQSWQICRDLAARLPFMVLPRWMSSRSQPVYIGDVVAALVHALSDRLRKSRVFDIPGPDTLTSREILFRIAALRGIKTLAVNVPVLSPRLSSYWLGLVTRANVAIARELVEGLVSDLVSTEPAYWNRMDGYTPCSFDEAARRALAEEVAPSWRTRMLESAMQRVAAKP